MRWARQDGDTHGNREPKSWKQVTCPKPSVSDGVIGANQKHDPGSRLSLVISSVPTQPIVVCALA